MQAKRVTTALGLAYLGTLGFWACGKKDATKNATSTASPSTSGASGTAPVGFLTAAATDAPTTVSTLDGPGAVAALVNSDDFYDNAPTAATTTCFDSLLKNLTLQGDDTALTATSTSDITSCYNTISGGFSFASVSLQYLLYASCPAGGLSSYVGKTVGDLDGATSCPSSYQQMGQLEIQAQNANYSGTLAGVASQFLVNSTTLSYYGSGTAIVPCVSPVTSGLATTTDCLSMHQTVTLYLDNASGSLYHANQYTGALSQNIVSNNDGKTVWPTSGSYTVVANNWSGTVSAQGATSLPTYVLTAQGSGSVISGTFPASSATASLRLMP